MLRTDPAEPDHPPSTPGSLALSVIVPVYNERHLVSASLARVLALSHPLINRLQVVVVDDCSTDGSSEVLRRIAASDPRVELHRHETNQGKGAAIRTALDAVNGDVTVVHDADLEYDPSDLPGLLVPFLEQGADAVFGSRYLSASYRRALMWRHTQINRFLTMLTSVLTDLDLTDVETCYKAIKTPLFKSIPIRSPDFRFEIEIAMKLAHRRARIFEVPIKYSPRSVEEGKKIKPRDGLLALAALLRYSVVDDIYKNDEYGSHILNDLHDARRFNKWMGDTLRPFVGDRVLEIGAGIGSLTNQFIPRESYVASDINPNHLGYLTSYAIGKPYLNIRRIDANSAQDFETLRGRFDTVVVVNVLEHLRDDQAALRNLLSALSPGGRLVALVPQHPGLYGTLDAALDHRERYTAEGLHRSLVSAGFEIERLLDFSRAAVPVWWLNGKLLKRKALSRIQLKGLELLMPFLRRVDSLWPWRGLSLIAVARRPA